MLANQSQQKVYDISLKTMLFMGVGVIIAVYLVTKLVSAWGPLAFVAFVPSWMEGAGRWGLGLVQYIIDRGGDATKYIAGALALIGPAIAVAKSLYSRGLAAKDTVIQAKNESIGYLGGQADTAMTQLNETASTLKITQDELASVKEQNASLTTLNNDLTARMENFGSVEDGFEKTIQEQAKELAELRDYKIKYLEACNQIEASRVHNYQ